MSAASKQASIVFITNKNGRLEFEINHEATKDTSEGIVIGDLYGYISDVNDNFMEIFGSQDKSLFVGKHVLEFVLKEEKARAVESSMASIVSNQEMTQQFRVHQTNGEEITVEVKTTLMKDEEGQNIGFIDFVRKIA